MGRLLLLYDGQRERAVLGRGAGRHDFLHQFERQRLVGNHCDFALGHIRGISGDQGAFEEFVRGTVGEVRARFEQDVVRGEVTLLLAPAPEPQEAPVEAVRAALRRLREEGMGLKQAAKAVAKETGRHAREVYRIGLELEDER